MKDLAQVLTNHFRVPESVPYSTCPVLAKARSNKVGKNIGRRRLGLAMNEMGVRSGIEIGTCKGASAMEWCGAIPGLQLTCVDPYKPYHGNDQQDSLDRLFEMALQKISDSGYDIDLWRASSRDTVSVFEDESVDFLFIDGDHTFDAVMMDLLQYAPKVRRGGIIALHDYFRSWDGGVMDAVDAYTKHHAISPWYVTYDVAPTAFWQRG